LRYGQLRGEIEAVPKAPCWPAVFPARERNDHGAVLFVMKPTPIISEKKAAIVIWISAAVFTIGAMIFGH
jgi:hypothetical protein